MRSNPNTYSWCLVLAFLDAAPIRFCCFDVLHTFDLRNIHNKVIDLCCSVAIILLKCEGHSVGPLWDDRPDALQGSADLLVLRLSVGVRCSPGAGGQRSCSHLGLPRLFLAGASPPDFACVRSRYVGTELRRDGSREPVRQARRGAAVGSAGRAGAKFREVREDSGCSELEHRSLRPLR